MLMDFILIFLPIVHFRQKRGYIMRNVRKTIIGAFSIVIVVSILSSAIAFIGYNKVIETVGKIEINKANQDKVLELMALSSQRQQVLTECVVSMNDERNKEFTEAGTRMDDIAGQLLNAKIGDSDRKIVQELLDISKKYNDTYINTMAADIQAFDNQSIADLSKNTQKLFEEIQKEQAALGESISKSLNTRINTAINDMEYFNKKMGLIYADSGDADRDLADIQLLLPEVWEQLAVFGTENAVPADELNKKADELKTVISRAAEKVKKNLADSQPSNANKIYNLRKIANELELLQKYNDLVRLTAENNSNLLYSAAAYEVTSENFNRNKDSIKQIYDDMLDSGYGKDTVTGIMSRHNNYDTAAGEIFKRTAIIHKAAVTNGYKSMTAMNSEFSDNVNKLKESFNNYLANDIKTSQRIKVAIFWIFIVIALISIGLGMFIAFMLSNKIANPINALIAMLARVEKGDLTVRADIRTHGEIGGLTKQVNSVLDGQQKLIEQFRDTTDEISNLKQRLMTLVKQNRDSMDKFSAYRKKNPQAAGKVLNSENMLTDVKTVSLQTQKAADDSKKAIEVAKSREETVKEAEKVIHNVNETVKSIAASIGKLESSSEKIGEITNTITQIASQTNLLALNAAIEANRAGEQGKGFAVVADEIRKLSNASNRSAGEIKAQIREIQNSISFAVEKMNIGVMGVEDGALRINEVKQGINEIIESVNMVASAIKESADKADTHYESTIQFIEAVDSMSKAADEASSGREGINDIIELQTNTLKDLDLISSLLHEASDELRNISDKVKI